MNLPDIRMLLDFHYWARTRVLDAADALTAEQWTRDLGSSFPSVRDTAVHLYSAEWAWLQRLHGTSPTAMLPPESYPDVPTLRSEWVEHEAKLRAFVEAGGEDALQRVVEYRMLNGKESRSRGWQIFHHITNHATYHRGQMTTMFRQLGVRPAKSMDLIGYYRERFPESP
jgi:uncharacterized damage-inducible protein DinB